LDALRRKPRVSIHSFPLVTRTRFSIHLSFPTRVFVVKNRWDEESLREAKNSHTFFYPASPITLRYGLSVCVIRPSPLQNTHTHNQYKGVVSHIEGGGLMDLYVCVNVGCMIVFALVHHIIRCAPSPHASLSSKVRPKKSPNTAEFTTTACARPSHSLPLEERG